MKPAQTTDERVEVLAEQLSGAILSRSRGYLIEWYEGRSQGASRLREFVTLDLFALKLGAWAALSEDHGDLLFNATSRKVGLKLAEQTDENAEQFCQDVEERHEEYRAAARGNTEFEDQMSSIASHFCDCLDDPPTVGWISGVFSLLLFSAHRSASTLTSDQAENPAER